MIRFKEFLLEDDFSPKASPITLKNFASKKKNEYESRFVIDHQGRMTAGGGFSFTHHELGGGEEGQTHGKVFFHPHSQKYSYIAWPEKGENIHPAASENRFKTYGIEPHDSRNPDHNMMSTKVPKVKKEKQEKSFPSVDSMPHSKLVQKHGYIKTDNENIFQHPTGKHITIRHNPQFWASYNKNDYRMENGNTLAHLKRHLEGMN